MELRFITASLSLSIVIIVALPGSWAESKKESGKTLSSFPDVGKTPSPGGPVPIPYPDYGRSSDTAKGSRQVKSKPRYSKGDRFESSSGDEAGNAGGIISQKKRGIIQMRDPSKVCAKEYVQSFPSLRKKCDSNAP